MKLITLYLLPMTVLCLAVVALGYAQELMTPPVSKSNMTVDWHHQEGRVHFTMEAPTTGWVSIGFNTRESLEGTYLLMGHVVNGQGRVVEHRTLRPGLYRPLTELGGTAQVQDVKGWEQGDRTWLSFSLPAKALCKQACNLQPGQSLVMLMAYSQDDDFQHHSLMRTSERVVL